MFRLQCTNSTAPGRLSQLSDAQGVGRGVYGIYPTDDTFGLIKQEAQSLNARAATVPGCDATAHTAPAVTTKDCTSTQVKGLVDTG